MKKPKRSMELVFTKNTNTVPVHTHKQSLQFTQNTHKDIKKPLLKNNSSLKNVNQSSLSNSKQQSSNLKKSIDRLKNVRSTSSILLTNKLTKTSFSIRDSSIVNRTNFKPQKPSIHKISKIKGADSLFIQRYSSNQVKQAFQSGSHNITQTQIPTFKINRKKAKTQSEANDLLRSSKSVKFKLLFRQKTELRRQTKSQRKMNRIDEKLERMKSHQRYLSSLLPPPPKKQVDNKIKPRGTIVSTDRIQKLTFMLMKNVQLFFNMYIHPKKVGDMIRGVDGYTKDIHKVLFSNQFMAKRITDPNQIYQYFWIFKNKYERPQYYGQEDLNFFNCLQNFTMKMDKSFDKLKVKYTANEQKDMQFKFNQFEKSYQSFKDKRMSDSNIDEIAKFIHKKKTINQQRRQDSMSKLQSLGVRFNVQQRTKQLIIRQRQTVLKKFTKR